MPVELAALPIASSGSVPAATTIVPVHILFFSEMQEQSNGGRAAHLAKLDCSIGQIL